MCPVGDLNLGITDQQPVHLPIDHPSFQDKNNVSYNISIQNELHASMEWSSNSEKLLVSPRFPCMPKSYSRNICKLNARCKSISGVYINQNSLSNNLKLLVSCMSYDLIHCFLDFLCHEIRNIFFCFSIRSLLKIWCRLYTEDGESRKTWSQGGAI